MTQHCKPGFSRYGRYVHSTPRTFGFFLMLLGAEGLGALPSPAQGTARITALSPTAWRIDTPDVRQKETGYTQITFSPGDEISVQAGGCVQTGGAGKTWKRYVDPSGPDSDKHYHGLIDIPGLTNGPVRLQDFGLNTVHAIPASLPPAVMAQGLYLRLGYEDNGYGDNGYNAHDDGTENQCKGSRNAYVVLSIGHGSAPLPASSIIGIMPGEFRCQAAWSFHNFNTAQLSYDSFKRAFHFAWYDYLDPLTIVTFYAARGNLASDGNCAGLSLLSEVAEDQFRVEDLTENLDVNYPGIPDWTNLPAKNVVLDINIAHWQQLSAYFLHNYLEAAARSPQDSAAQIAKDLSSPKYNYGLLSIAHGTAGHVIVPLKATRQSNGDWLIDVWDPNRPCQPDFYPDASLAQVRISGDSWSYLMERHTTPWTGKLGGDALAYIPYRGPDVAWRKLGTNLSGLVGIAFGAGSDVNQVTDSAGRKLYKPGTRTLDDGPNGLGRSLFHVPMHGQTSSRRDQAAAPYVFAQSDVVPPRLQNAAREIEGEYGPPYDGSGNFFLVNDSSLSDLTFELASSTNGAFKRVMLQQGQQFVELRMGSGAAAKEAPTFTLHKPGALITEGITVRNAKGSPMPAEFVFGESSEQTQSVRLQHVTVPVAAGTRVRLAPEGVHVSAGDASLAAQVREENIDQTGKRTSAARSLQVTKEK